MNNFKDDEITELLCDYVKEETYNYAIMLDGEWGSGKTYFIKNKFVPRIESLTNAKEENYVSIYISLYGLQNVDEIRIKLYESILLMDVKFSNFAHKLSKKINKIGTYKKINRLIHPAAKGIKHFFLKGSPDLEKVATDIYSGFKKLDKYILIVDDLERCDISINAVLGYLNSFVEHEGLKMIIIANEKEIGNINRNSNLELKYILAANTSIKTEDDTPSQFEKSLSDKTKKDNSEFTLDKIRQRVNVLFNINAEYNLIKEKLIGQTISYLPPIDELVPKILNSFLEKDIDQKFREKAAKEVIEIMSNIKCYNIRTLQSALIMFKKIIKIMPKENYDDEVVAEVMQKVFHALIKITFYYKQTNKKYNWKSEGEYANICLDDNTRTSKNNLFSFKFLHQLIYDSSLDQSYVFNVLDEFLKHTQDNKNNSLVMDPMNKLAAFYIMDDDEISNSFDQLYTYLIENKYRPIYYQWILSLAYKLESLKLPLNHHPLEFVEIITKYVDRDEVRLKLIQAPQIYSDDLLYNEYVNAVETLKNRVDTKYEEEQISILNGLITGQPGWAEDFQKYCIKNNDIFSRLKKFISLIDLDKCINAIMQGKASDIYHFNSTLSHIYSFSNIKDYFITDKDVLFNLEKALSNVDFATRSQMKEINKNMLLKNIENILDKLKEE